MCAIYFRFAAFAVLVSAPALAAPPCQLTESDYNTLANADPPLSREQVNGLQGDHAQNLCSARRMVRLSETTQNLTCEDHANQFWLYVSKEELRSESLRKITDKIRSDCVRRFFR